MRLHQLVLFLSFVAYAGLDGLSLKDLQETRISSVSKRSESLQRVPASITVISREDILHSGATRLQEVLMLVPGFWSADYSYDAPSAAMRDAATFMASTYLVLLDGVPLNSPMVGWFAFPGFDLDLQSIERIEVIRGSAGTIYGANAASGVVSIFTRSTEKEETISLSAEGGSNGYRAGALRFAQDIGKRHGVSGWLRWKEHAGYDTPEAFRGDTLVVSGERMLYLSPDPELVQNLSIVNAFGQENANRLDVSSGGLRFDSHLGEHFSNRIFFTGRNGTQNKYSKQSFPFAESFTFTPLTPDSIWQNTQRNQSFIVSNRADFSLAEGHDFFANVWYSWQRLKHPALTGFDLQGNATELELQDNLTFFSGNELTLGVSLRQVRYQKPKDMGPKSQIRFLLSSEYEYMSSAFVQDKWRLTPTLDLQAGVKVEHWTLLDSDPEWSPSLRTSWIPLDRLTFWGALSRSITIPGQIEYGMEGELLPLPSAWMLSLGGMDSIPAAGGWISILTPDKVVPVIRRSADLGMRYSLGKLLDADVGLSLVDIENETVLVDIDPDLQAIDINSRGDTVLPMYFANAGKRMRSIAELQIGSRAVEWFRPQLSYSWNRGGELRTKDLPISSFGGGSGNTTPIHILRWKLLFKARGAYLNLFGSWASSYWADDTFNQVTQAPEPVELGGKRVKDLEPELRFHATAGIRFFDERLLLNIWARNLFVRSYVQNFDQFVGVGYPHEVHSTWGTGLHWEF